MIQLDLNSPEFQANLLALPQQKPWAVLKTRSLPATQCRRIDCAALGQQVAGVLDPDKLLDVASGLAALKVEPITSTAVAPEQVFAALEQQRHSGQLSQSVSGASLRYQASKAQPGLLEEIKPNDNRRLGRFRNGLFEPTGESAPSTNP